MKRIQADYDRRILTMVREFPAKLLWIVYSKPDIVCPKRQEIAVVLLNTLLELLHPTARKIRRVCE